ncbi:MAG: hypothetical protein JSR15_10675 [Proteobacteria bacterium]|nr:hypothetical protein [Pseudomonadota bacterium]
MELQPKKPDSVADATEASESVAPAEADVRGDTLNRIRKSLVTSRLTLAAEAAGGNPYDSGAGRGPGAVWGQRRR